MFSNQRSQGQAVSTSKHGRVCAQGCRHRPRTPGEGTSGQDPERCHQANKSRFGEPQATTGLGGASLQTPPGAAPLLPQQVTALSSTSREPPPNSSNWKGTAGAWG